MRTESRHARRLSLTIILISIGLLPVPSWSSDESVPDHPGPRWGHVFIYNPAQDQILLFGGALERGTYLGDTWTWDGLEWKVHEVPGPLARGFAAAAFHAERKTIVLHGGRGNDRKTYSDTWEWRGSSWQVIDTAGPFHADHHQAVYIPKDTTILVFGGWTGEEVSDDTWVWNKEWTKLDISGPPARAAFGMTYDSHLERVLLYGGLWIDGQYADIWAWKDGAWKSLSSAYDHSSLDHLAAVYDESKHQIVGFGGKNYRRVMQRHTLSITDTMITRLSSEGPSARHSIGLTYDSRQNLIWLYGGKEYQGEEHVPLGDFWKWDGKTWTPLDP